MNIKTLAYCIIYFSVNLIISQEIQINEGSGFFKILGGIGHENDTITVYYHKPKNLTEKSKILMIIPGSGRNGDSYKNSWVEISEKHSVFIISPSYPEKKYAYDDYHLGGIVKNLDLKKGIIYKKNSNQVLMNEDIIKFNINTNNRQWIYNDFDKIFKIVKKTTKSKQRKYDMFGHSAGGQILHRFVLMHPKSKANKILASNSGTYTLPDYKTNYPFGMKNTELRMKDLEKSFRKKLVLFIGEKDNENETGGKMLRSKTADLQGGHRLARGKYFYNESTEISKKLNMEFNWQLIIIPNIGHNQKKMAKAAAKYLYAE